MKNYVIFAPHMDDEVINCFEYLYKGVVSDVYFYNFDKKRLEGARMCAKYFGFNLHVNFPQVIPKNKIILCPNIKDLHPSHKEVNFLVKKHFPNHKKIFYTTDRNTDFFVLPKYLQIKKEKILDRFYPSEQVLWKTNRKYVLFEGFAREENSKFIWVKTQFDGIHRWQTCNIPEVDFLKNYHRHQFQIKVGMNVNGDREVEFYKFKMKLDKIIVDLYGKRLIKDLGNRSCEVVAKDIHQALLKSYPDRNIEVEVSEDGQAGVGYR